jgi:hypothetical protein
MQFTIILLPVISSFAYSLDTTRALFTHLDANSGNRWMTEDDSLSEEWNLQCEQESKQPPDLFIDFFAVRRLARPPQLQPLVVSTPVPISHFLSRKLSPRSADDDPLLS